ncbi:Hypothetical protein, putative [Bodo saltans]|uniref:F5/8 type C domain-containing protein n=1 Tax=Bodo saltans TaxID=75058 RepID=A0A0S4JMN7_BODSA|nr:Hypothetical protein, putative [Bodo saltans]|eukprot:CUG90370.1 Hypothetical protein, putative [Bodo saltans]
MMSYLYPPHVSCTSMQSQSPRAAEGSPTMARRDTMASSTFLTEANVRGFSRSSSKKTPPPQPMLPSTFEQQQNRCRCWHHEFHNLLQTEVRTAHQKLSQRTAQRQQARNSSSSAGALHSATQVSSIPQPPPPLDGSLPASPDMSMHEEDLTGAVGGGAVGISSAGNASTFVGEVTAQQQLLGGILNIHPVPHSYYGSVLPNAPTPTWLAPELMSLPMASFLKEFEEACEEGADAVWQHIVRSQTGDGENNSLTGSPSNKSGRTSSFSNMSPSPYALNSGFFGSGHRSANPNFVRMLEDERGMDTENFFVYKHMIFNVLPLMGEDMLALFGCAENAVKAAAAEVRALQHIIHMAYMKGSLTLQAASSSSGSGGAGGGAGGVGGAAEGAPRSAAVLSFPLVCLVRYRGIAMFVVAQPNTTPVESVIAGPSTDGIHIPSNSRHTGLLQQLCSLLRVPNHSYFLTPQHQKLMSQCPSLGHPDLTVTLTTKLSKEYESSVVGDAMIGALFPYRMPYLSASKLRSWVSKKRPFGNHSTTEEDEEESQLHGSIPAQHVTEVLIVQNVARLVGVAADLTQTILMPHIVSPSLRSGSSVGVGGGGHGSSIQDKHLLSSPTPSTLKKTPTPPPSSISSTGFQLAVMTRGGSVDMSPGTKPQQHHAGLLLLGDNSANRFLHTDKGGHLSSMIHPNFILTLPYDQEVVRCEFSDPRGSKSISSDSSREPHTMLSAEATKMLLTDRIPAMMTWLLHMLDSIGDDSGCFVDTFNGEVLKGIMKAWGCNMRYLGVVHAKLCDLIQQRCLTAFSATEGAMKRFLAAKAAVSGVALATGAIANQQGGSSNGASPKGATSKKHLLRQTAIQQQTVASLAASVRAHGSPFGSGLAGGNAANTTPQVSTMTPSSANSAVNSKRFGGRLFLNRSIHSLDSPKLSSCIQDTLDGLSNLLGKLLDSDAPSAPQAQQMGHTNYHHRASVVTTGALSTNSGISGTQQYPNNGNNNFQPAPSTPPRKVHRKVRCPADRTPLEHVLMVVRAEMISRCFRNIFSEQERLLTIQQASLTGKDANEDSIVLPQIGSTSATPRQTAKLAGGSGILGLAAGAHGTSTSLASPQPDEGLFLPNAARLPIVPAKPAAPPQSNSARLYQKLKDLDSVWKERNQMGQRTTDEGMTARSIDKLVIMDAVQQSKRYGAPDGAPRVHNPFSVLKEDPHPRFEPDGGVFESSRPDPEKSRVAELLRYLIGNSGTSTSQLFWQQMLMSELWVKYGNFAGASFKRTDIQLVDMVIVLHRAVALCGIVLSKEAIAAIEQSVQSKSSGVDEWGEDSIADFNTTSSKSPNGGRNRIDLSHVRLSHHSVDAILPRLRSTLRRVVTLDVMDVGRKQTSRHDAAVLRERAKIGGLSQPQPAHATEPTHDDIFDSKVLQLERDLYTLQETRFIKSGKKFKEGLGDAATVRELTILEALIRLNHLGGARRMPHHELAVAQHTNAELVIFYHTILKSWKKVGFDGICYRPCGGCGVLFNASVTEVHQCGGTILTKVDREDLPIGISDGKLPSMMIAASSHIPGFEPNFARKCVPSASWRPAVAGHDHYIEFHFSTVREIKAMEMTGDSASRFVQSFQIMYTMEHKDEEVFTGNYFRRDDNPDAEGGGAHSATANGGKGERMRARPFVHNNAARDPTRLNASPRRPRPESGEEAAGLRSPVGPNAFGSITFVNSMRRHDSIGNLNQTMASSRRLQQTSGGKSGIGESGNFSMSSYPDFQSGAFGRSSGEDLGGAGSPSSQGSNKLRPTFLRGNTNGNSLVRIQFEQPFRCNSLKLIVGNEDAATAALNVEFFYTSRPMPSLGRNGCEKISVNHVNWSSEVQLSTFGESGSIRNLGGVIPHSMRMTRRDLAEKEHVMLARIFEIEAQVEDKTAATLAKALPYECVLIRTSSELQSLWSQLLQLLIMWGMERSSDVQYAQFRLLRYHLGEIKLYARCDQMDIAAARADRLMKKLDDAVGPLGFGGIAMLVGPLMALIFDAVQCAGVAARHIPDFYHMVEWASEVRHPLTIELTAVLIDAAGYGTEDDRAEAATLCEQLAAQGRLGDVTRLLLRPEVPGIPPMSFSTAVVNVFKQLREKEVFLRTDGETETSRFPDESEDVRRRMELEVTQDHQLGEGDAE